MKSSSTVVKIFVLVMSLTLAGCFVAYRAGAFKGRKDGGTASNTPSVPDAAPMMPSSKSMELPDRSPEVPAEVQGSDDEMMGSSKSGKIFRVDSPRKAMPEQDPSNNTFMGSSKNDGVFEPNAVRDTQPPIMHIEPAGFINGNRWGKYPKPPKPVQQDTLKPVQVAPSDDDFMGSSKSAPVFSPPAKIVTVKPTPQPPTNPGNNANNPPK